MYKKDIDQTIKRLSALFTGQGIDRIYAKMFVSGNVVKKYESKYPSGEMDYPDLDQRAQFWDEYLFEQKDIEDDSMPCAYMSEFDEGLYAGLLGAETRFMYNPDWGWVSSMSVPFLKDADELKGLKPDMNGRWGEKYLHQLRFFAEKAKDRYGISHFILIDGLNLLLELRGGTNVYLDILDHPEIVSDFIVFAREFNIMIQEIFFQETGLYKGGTFSNLGQWMPGRIVTESLDPFHMASEEFFEQWGKENVEKIFEHFDGGCIHLHQGNCRHLLKSASRLRGIKLIAVIDEDFNPDKAYMHLDEYSEICGSIPLCISIPYEVFLKRLDRNDLPCNNLYFVTSVKSTDEANKTMEKVRKYRR